MWQRTGFLLRTHEPFELIDLNNILSNLKGEKINSTSIILLENSIANDLIKLRFQYDIEKWCASDLPELRNLKFYSFAYIRHLNKEIGLNKNLNGDFFLVEIRPTNRSDYKYTKEFFEKFRKKFEDLNLKYSVLQINTHSDEKTIGFDGPENCTNFFKSIMQSPIIPTNYNLPIVNWIKVIRWNKVKDEEDDDEEMSEEEKRLLKKIQTLTVSGKNLNKLDLYEDELLGREIALSQIGWRCKNNSEAELNFRLRFRNRPKCFDLIIVPSNSDEEVDALDIDEEERIPLVDKNILDELWDIYLKTLVSNLIVTQ